MAQDTKGNAGKGHETAAPAAPNWAALVKAWADKRAALAKADNELAKMLVEHDDKSFTIAGIGVISGVKAKGKTDTFYVKVSDPQAPEELSI